MRGDARVNAQMDDVRKAGAEIAITSISLCELYKGAYLSNNHEQNLAIVNAFLKSVLLLTQNRISCVLFGQDFAELRKRGTPTQDNDLMIASICKANNCQLVTRNIKDFRNIPNLVVDTW